MKYNYASHVQCMRTLLIFGAQQRRDRKMLTLLALVSDRNPHGTEYVQGVCEWADAHPPQNPNGLGVEGKMPIEKVWYEVECCRCHGTFGYLGNATFPSRRRLCDDCRDRRVYEQHKLYDWRARQKDKS